MGENVANGFRMSQSLSRILVHGIWSTKQRAPHLLDEWRPALHAYVVGVFGKLGCPVIEVNSEPDHIHVLFVLARTLTVASLLEKVKSASSGWMKSEPAQALYFQWQGGYATFSVSESRMESVCAYIRNQREHHRGLSFQDELRAILRRHRVSFDERYLWD